MKYQENIVPATNQNPYSLYLSEKEGSPRVLFCGNSITKHGIKTSIGWDRDCGMAASDLDHDYVHVFARAFSEKYPDAVYGIAQVAVFERGFETMDIRETYQLAADWKPDIVISFFGANVPGEYDKNPNPTVTFGEKYEELRNLLGAKLYIHSEGFYIRPKLNAEKKAVADKYGDIWVTMSDINQLAETHGLFNHPNDEGMRRIAQKFLDAVFTVY
ncbi:MAG: SGNH/GDSL hydrolase family protein [Clostridia bacterium]|nr:SGNH/GDSL hydrolase family protein [Clostridia bacterium]